MPKINIQSNDMESLIKHFFEESVNMSLFSSHKPEENEYIKLYKGSPLYIRMILKKYINQDDFNIEDANSLKLFKEFIYNNYGINYFKLMLKDKNKYDPFVFNFYCAYQKTPKNLLIKIHNGNEYNLPVDYICRSIMSPFNNLFNIDLYNKIDTTFAEDFKYRFNIKKEIENHLEKTFLRRFLDGTSSIEEMKKSPLSQILSLNDDSIKKIILENEEKTDYFFRGVNDKNLSFALNIITDYPELLTTGKLHLITRLINYYGSSESHKQIMNTELLANIIFLSKGDEKTKKEWFETLTTSLEKSYHYLQVNYPKEDNKRLLNFIPETYLVYEKILINNKLNEDLSQEKTFIKKRL